MGELSNDITITCADENGISGVKRVFIANRTNITSFTAGALQDYTAVTMAATSDLWFEIEVSGEPGKGGAYIGEGSIENGASVSAKTVTLDVPKLEKTKGLALQQLFTSCRVVMIIEMFDSTGTYNRAIVVGWDEIFQDKAALRAAINETLEADNQGLNGYTITATGNSGEMAREFVGSIETNGSGTVNFGS